MKRATSYLQPYNAPAHYPCDACGGKKFAWCEMPYPGHNFATLYECQDCGGVFTLADILGEMVEWLP